jgi:hypothetical protein
MKALMAILQSWARALSRLDLFVPSSIDSFHRGNATKCDCAPMRGSGSSGQVACFDGAVTHPHSCLSVPTSGRAPPPNFSAGRLSIPYTDSFPSSLSPASIDLGTFNDTVGYEGFGRNATPTRRRKQDGPEVDGRCRRLAKSRKGRLVGPHKKRVIVLLATTPHHHPNGRDGRLV